MNLERRIRLLEQRLSSLGVDTRMILCWVDEAGHLTKVADSHPHLPDDGVYSFDWSVPGETHPAGRAEC